MEEGRLRGRADLCSADGYAVGCHENKDGNRQAVSDGSWKVEGRHRALPRYVCFQGRRETHPLPLPCSNTTGICSIISAQGLRSVCKDSSSWR
jgi:hypothetical protein